MIFSRYSQIYALSGCSISLGFLVFNREIFDRCLAWKTVLIKNNKAAFCDDYLHKLMIQVGTEMNIPKETLQNIVLYYNSANCPLFSGSLTKLKTSLFTLNCKSAPCIGLPQFFKHQFFDECSFDKLVMNEKLIDIEADSPEGVEFRSYLLLSEDAKKFVLARQLHYLRSNIDIIKVGSKIIAGYLAYQILFCLARFSSLSKLKTSIMAFPICAVIWCSLYAFQNQIIEIYSDSNHFEADSVARDLGHRYRTGGIEFYSKFIKVNKMLYKWGFSKNFTEIGNDVDPMLFRYSNVNHYTRIGKLLDLFASSEEREYFKHIPRD